MSNVPDWLHQGALLQDAAGRRQSVVYLAVEAEGGHVIRVRLSGRREEYPLTAVLKDYRPFVEDDEDDEVVAVDPIPSPPARIRGEQLTLLGG